MVRWAGAHQGERGVAEGSASVERMGAVGGEMGLAGWTHPAIALRKRARIVIQPPAYEMDMTSGEKRWRRPMEEGSLPASPFSNTSHSPREM